MTRRYSEEVWVDPMCGCTRSPDASGICPIHGTADWYVRLWYYRAVAYSVAFAIWHRVDAGGRLSNRCKIFDKIDVFLTDGCERNVPDNHPWAEDPIF